MSYVKIGVGGPVGSGKTALIERLTRKMSKEYSICVVTNDIYTKEDAEFLIKNSALPAERIVGVETGGCPHTAIREDCSMNLEAVEEMAEKFPDVEIIFIESGGDNLSATFSPDLADVTIYVIDVAQGEKIPRKGGPGVTRSDLLVINKTDLAPMVGASLEVMARDSERMRQGRDFLFTNLMQGDSVDAVIDWIKRMHCWRGSEPMASEFRLTVGYDPVRDRSYRASAYFTAPIKLGEPRTEGDRLQLMLMMASAGILAGDSFSYDIRCQAGSRTLITEQSYTKLFDMGEAGLAKRVMSAALESGASLWYRPCALVPFRNSDFRGKPRSIWRRTVSFCGPTFSRPDAWAWESAFSSGTMRIFCAYFMTGS